MENENLYLYFCFRDLILSVTMVWELKICNQYAYSVLCTRRRIDTLQEGIAVQLCVQSGAWKGIGEACIMCTDHSTMPAIIWRAVASADRRRRVQARGTQWTYWTPPGWGCGGLGKFREQKKEEEVERGKKEEEERPSDVGRGPTSLAPRPVTSWNHLVRLRGHLAD